MHYNSPFVLLIHLSPKCDIVWLSVCFTFPALENRKRREKPRPWNVFAPHRVYISLRRSGGMWWVGSLVSHAVQHLTAKMTSNLAGQAVMKFRLIVWCDEMMHNTYLCMNNMFIDCDETSLMYLMLLIVILLHSELQSIEHLHIF